MANRDNRHRKHAKKVLRSLRRKHFFCAWCGRHKHGMELDIVDPTSGNGHRHHAWETNRRAYYYRRQDKAGNLQGLCWPCHAKKTRAQMTACNCAIDITQQQDYTPVNGSDSQKQKPSTERQQQLCKKQSLNS
jgi:hypothetical protein